MPFTLPFCSNFRLIVFENVLLVARKKQLYLREFTLFVAFAIKLVTLRGFFLRNFVVFHAESNDIRVNLHYSLRLQ